MSFVSQIDATRAMAPRRARAERTRIAQAKQMAPAPASTALKTYAAAADKYIERVNQLVDAGDVDKLAAYLANVKTKTVSRRTARQAQQHARAELGRALGKRIPVSAVGDKAVQDAFVLEQERLFNKLGADVLAAVQAGDLAGAKRLAANRARLITSDQVFKVSSEATGHYAIANGAPTYVWITRLDERVRPRHAAQHGKVHRWDAPPSVGREGQHFHPGQDVFCRCQASPVPPT